MSALWLTAQDNDGLFPPQPLVTHDLPADSLSAYNLLDSLPIPDHLLLQGEADGNYYIGKANKGGFTLFQLPDIGNIIQVETHDINGTGQAELILHRSVRNGRSGWESGHAWHRETMEIYDVDQPALLLSFEYCQEQENWWTQYVEPEHDSIHYEEREVIETGGEHWSECYTIEWDNGMLLFLPIAAGIAEAEEPFQEQLFRWTGEGFVQP